MKEISNKKILNALFLLAISGFLLIFTGITFAQTQTGKRGVSRNKSTKTVSPKPRKRTFIEVASIPTPPETVTEMLRLANLKKGDILYDLGSGDGRIPLEAARIYGVRAIGIEIKPKLVEEANQRAKAEGIGHLAKFLQADLFRMSYRDATVVTLYLSDALNERLLPKLLRELRPGARIISHDFRMGGWQPEISVKVPWKNLYRNVHVWTIPKDKNIKNLPQGARNLKPESDSMSLELNKTQVIIPCPPGNPTPAGCIDNGVIEIKTNISPSVKNPEYQYSISGGRIIGTGEKIKWDLKGVRPGTYTIAVTVDSKGNFRKILSKKITVAECACPDFCECPNLSVNSSSESVQAGENIIFTANVRGGTQTSAAYKWRISDGQIIEGQGTPVIKVGTKGLAGKTITAVIEIGEGICEVCLKTATATVKVE